MSEPDERKKTRDTEVDPGIFELPFDLADLTSGVGDGELSAVFVMVGLVLIVPLLAYWLVLILWRTGRAAARRIAG